MKFEFNCFPGVFGACSLFEMDELASLREEVREALRFTDESFL